MEPYRIRTYTDKYTLYELTETSTGSWVRLCPERGGIVLEFGVNGKELLYLDKETFYDEKANIRGGIPVLFPISGQLAEGRYEWEGVSYTMANHGVARINPWQVESTDVGGHAAITLTLTDHAGTLASYPFRFELTFTYVLKDGKLSILQRYRNRSDQPMPIYAGFHPYFAADTKKLAYRTDATRYLDYNDGGVKAFDGTVDLSGLKESVVFLDAGDHQISFQPADGVRVRMTYSDSFRYVVLWSVEGKPFVCVEPWMAKNGELNAQQELVMVQPGETLEAELTIAADIG